MYSIYVRSLHLGIFLIKLHCCSTCRHKNFRVANVASKIWFIGGMPSFDSTAVLVFAHFTGPVVVGCFIM